MILNKKAQEMFAKGIDNIPLKNWKIFLTDAYQEDLYMDNIYPGSVIAKGKFDVSLGARKEIHSTKTIALSVVITDRIAYPRSAVVEIKKGVRFSLSCSEIRRKKSKKAELNFGINKLIPSKGSNVTIDHFVIGS